MARLSFIGTIREDGHSVPFSDTGEPGGTGKRRMHNSKSNEILSILHSLGPLAAMRLMRDSLLSLNHYYVLGRSLTTPFVYPFLKKPAYSLVPLSDDDVALIQERLPSLEAHDRRELLGRLHFRSCGFNNCFVMKADGEIAYLQWLIFPNENEVIRRNFSGKFYPLTEKQVMVENVYTFPRYRGRGLLPFGTLQLLQLAKDSGYSSVICYIRKDNITSLNEFSKMGFKILKIIKEYKMFGKAWRTL